MYQADFWFFCPISLIYANLCVFRAFWRQYIDVNWIYGIFAKNTYTTTTLEANYSETANANDLSKSYMRARYYFKLIRKKIKLISIFLAVQERFIGPRLKTERTYRFRPVRPSVTPYLRNRSIAHSEILGDVRGKKYKNGSTAAFFIFCPISLIYANLCVFRRSNLNILTLT